MSALKITERQAGDVMILDLEGNITIGEDRATLCDMITRLLAAGKMNVLLNLAQVKLVDSSGLGALVTIHTMVTNAGGQVKLLHVTRSIRNLMAITKLSTVFDFYEDELIALNDYTLGPQYQLIPYEGEIVSADVPDERLYAWLEQDPIHDPAVDLSRDVEQSDPETMRKTGGDAQPLRSSATDSSGTYSATPTGGASSDAMERRGAVRAPAYRLILQVHGEGSLGKVSGVLSNLSTSGCFIRTYGRVATGERIQIWILLPTERWQPVKGQVIYQIEREGFGLRFVELTAEGEALLALLVEYISGHSANYSYGNNQVASNAPAEEAPRQERRLYARSCPLTIDLVEEKEAAYVATIENISMGGLYLRAKNALPEGASTTLGLPIGEGKYIEVRVEVIHSHPGRGFGVCFHWLSETDPNRIALAREMVSYEGRRLK